MAEVDQETERDIHMPVGAQPIKNVNIKPLTEREAWKALETHYRKIRGSHLRELFAAARELQRKFGFEPNFVVKAAKELLGR